MTEVNPIGQPFWWLLRSPLSYTLADNRPPFVTVRDNRRREPHPRTFADPAVVAPQPRLAFPSVEPSTWQNVLAVAARRGDCEAALSCAKGGTGGTRVAVY